MATVERQFCPAWVRWVLRSGIALTLILTSRPAAAESLCEPAAEDCRSALLTLIRNEQVGIDVAFWFMEDARYTHELIERWRAGVPVRVLMDTRANASYPLNAERLAELRAAGIPMRGRTGGGILHWKMMLFAGQNVVEFSAANYSPEAFGPGAPYEDYIDEAIYFTDDTATTNSFRTKFDDLWTDTSYYSHYANITTPPIRRYPVFTKDPALNFPPTESYRSRAVQRYNAETAAIDVIMYRITDRAHADAMIRAVQRGVPVRLITEPAQYRDRKRYWHAWNVDRMYAAGVQIRHRAHRGLTHQKSVLLRAQGLTIFGSSNWTSPSSNSQEEHNYFTHKPWIFYWFLGQFERKWQNGAGVSETTPFLPLPPDHPVNVSPANGSRNHKGDTITLTWNAGIWAHLYDIYFGTSPSPPLFAANQSLGPSTNSHDHRRFTVSGLVPGKMYYWRVVAKTMANVSAEGPVSWFRTIGDGAASSNDFDGDTRSDVAVYRPPNGVWYIAQSGSSDPVTRQWGWPGDVPVSADYDGDGRTDIAVYRPSTGVWHINGAAATLSRQWGWPLDVPVPADYDRDGRADIAVYRPSTGVWYIVLSGSGAISTRQWGAPGDIPAPADYDGDGYADIAVYRPATGFWFIDQSRSGLMVSHQWGWPGDVPLPADYDGDGRADPTVYRPSTGVWYQLRTLTNSGYAVLWGAPGDVPVVGDHDGDSRADPTVFRPSTGTWYQLWSSTGSGVVVGWGTTGDVPR